MGFGWFAEVLCEIMRNACLQHKFTYDTEKPAARLALLVADSELRWSRV